MPLDKSNYINSIWSSLYNIFVTEFTDYTIDTEKLDSGTTIISSPTVLILNPRVGRLGQKKTYNEEQRKRYRINIFCLTDNQTSNGLAYASEMAGNISEFVEKNQHLFSVEGLQMAQIVSEDPLNFNYTGSDLIAGYVLVLQGNVTV